MFSSMFLLKATLWTLLSIFSYWYIIWWTSLVAQTVKSLPVMQVNWVQSLGPEDPPEKGMTTHSSILAWRIPWTEEPGRLQSMSKESDTTEQLTLSLFLLHLTWHCQYLDIIRQNIPNINLTEIVSSQLVRTKQIEFNATKFEITEIFKKFQNLAAISEVEYDCVF